ncbi:MAG: hypothetical protein AB1472_01970 [Candidatus Omnitrophota bacterium]
MLEEGVKNRLILILGILTVIFFLSTISSCAGLGNQKNQIKKEMMARLQAEEKLDSIQKQTEKQTAEFKSLQAQLEEEKASNQATKKALVQEQTMNQSYKEEIDKLTKLKEVLEENLKDALSKARKAK